MVKVKMTIYDQKKHSVRYRAETYIYGGKEVQFKNGFVVYFPKEMLQSMSESGIFPKEIYCEFSLYPK